MRHRVSARSPLSRSWCLFFLSDNEVPKKSPVERAVVLAASRSSNSATGPHRCASHRGKNCCSSRPKIPDRMTAASTTQRACSRVLTRKRSRKGRACRRREGNRVVQSGHAPTCRSAKPGIPFFVCPSFPSSWHTGACGAAATRRPACSPLMG